MRLRPEARERWHGRGGGSTRTAQSARRARILRSLLYLSGPCLCTRFGSLPLYVRRALVEAEKKPPPLSLVGFSFPNHHVRKTKTTSD
mgnify:CR=1 FL=1